jgi:hypothetical protein
MVPSEVNVFNFVLKGFETKKTTVVLVPSKIFLITDKSTISQLLIYSTLYAEQ